MRIRRCASKLLGSTTGYVSPTTTPTPTLCSSLEWDSEAASAAAAAGLLCELNRSPWDLVPNHHQHAVSQEVDDAAAAADDYDRGAPANGVKLERKPVDPPLIKSDVKIKLEEEEKKVKKRVKRRRKEKGIDAAVGTETSETATPFCKKSDGKGWHCKRLADLPHTLCHYHLTQLRSYASSNSHGKVADQATGGGDKQRKKKADAAGDGTNFYYYYYSGFGPWRGKRRGGPSTDDGGGSGRGDGVNGNGNVTEEEEEEEEEEGKENSESVDGSDAPVAGDDEEDNEDEDDGKGCLDEEEEEDDDKKNSRKRGRKPVKARSLMSLL